jgi:hypothetical protein
MTETYPLDQDPLQTELEQAKQRLDELRRAKKLRDLARAKQRCAEAGIPEKPHVKLHPPTNTSATDYAYGARAIGRITGQDVGTVYYWHKNGMYGDAVWAAGPKSLVGSVAKLKNLGPR